MVVVVAAAAGGRPGVDLPGGVLAAATPGAALAVLVLRGRSTEVAMLGEDVSDLEALTGLGTGMRPVRGGSGAAWTAVAMLVVVAPGRSSFRVSLSPG